MSTTGCASTAAIVCLLVCFGGSANAQTLPMIELRRGLVITRSVRIAPKVYRLAAPASLDSAVITIRGDNISVDFTGATLEGIDPDADPDLGGGVAIRVEAAPTSAS